MKHDQIYEKALAELDEAVLEPGSPHTAYARGLVAYLFCRSRQACQDLEAAMEGAASGVGFYLLGLSLSQSGKPGAADIAFRQAVALRPDLLSAHLEIARGLRSQDRCDEAVEVLEHARRTVSHRGSESYIDNELGITYEALGKHEKAADLYQRAAADRGDSSIGPRANLALLLYKLGRSQEARHLLEGICQDFENVVPPCTAQRVSALVYFVLGNICLDGDQNERAQSMLATSIRFNPDSAPAHNALAVSYEAVGEHESAIRAVKKALQINPDYTAAQRNLEYLSCAAAGEVS
jgi:tetratricopeptide (TPR) repeat protein